MGTQYVRRPLALPTGEKCRLTALGKGIVALLVAGNRTNLATGRPLSVIADAGWQYSTPSPQGMAFPFRRNASVSTEALPAIGAASFVTFWAGYPGPAGVRGQTPNQLTMLVGSNDASNAIFSSKATTDRGSSSSRIDTWGAVAGWPDDIPVTDDVLTPWKFTALCTVWRKSTIDFYRDGKRVYSYPRNAATSIGSNSLVIGSFVTDPYWNSSSDTTMAGRIMGEWTDDQACAWTSNHLRLFAADRLPVFSATASAAPIQLTGGANLGAAVYGTLSTLIPLTGAASARTAAAGTLSTAIPLSGVAAARASVTGALSTSVTLAGAAQVRADAAGELSTAIALQGDAVTRTGAIGALSSAIALAGSAAVRSVVAGDLAGGPATLSGTITVRAGAAGSLSTSITLIAAAVARAYATGALSSRISLGGSASMVTAMSGVLTAGRAPSRIDISKVSPARIVRFDGSGSRIVAFEGSGKRTRINEMSAKGPTKVGDKWMCDRDPDEESYYFADITDELVDRFTSVKDSADAIEIIVHGVEQVGTHDLQVAEVGGVERTFVVVFLVGIDADPPDDWHWLARVRCANGERFDKTTWFKRMDT